MQNDRQRQARAIAIAKTADDRFKALEIIAFAATMAAACLYGLMTFIL
jgi:hypothetical protein